MKEGLKVPDKKPIEPMEHHNIGDFLKGQSSKILTAIANKKKTAFVLKNGKASILWLSSNATQGRLKPGLISMIINMEAFRMAKEWITDVVMDDASITLILYSLLLTVWGVRLDVRSLRVFVWCWFLQGCVVRLDKEKIFVNQYSQNNWNELSYHCRRVDSVADKALPLCSFL